MTITDATFELTKCGAVENGFAVVEGKKVSVMRIWEYCECLCDYYVDTVIVNDMCEAPKAEEKKEEKKKMNVASLMSGFNKLTKMGVKESESRAKEATPHAESHVESHTASTATTEDMFGGLSSTPTKSPSDDLFGGLSSTPQGEGDNLFGGLSSAPESMPEQKTEPAEEDLLNLNAAPAEEEKKTRWGMPFGRKGAKEEKKKGFGLGSLMKGFGSKGPSTFPPTEVSAREGDEV